MSMMREAAAGMRGRRGRRGRRGGGRMTATIATTSMSFERSRRGYGR
jgi:hypothetical protein